MQASLIRVEHSQSLAIRKLYLCQAKYNCWFVSTDNFQKMFCYCTIVNRRPTACMLRDAWHNINVNVNVTALQWLFLFFTQVQVGLKTWPTEKLLIRMKLTSKLNSYRAHINVNNCDWNTCKLVFTVMFTVGLGPRSFSVAGPSLWNTLPSDMKQSSLSITQFCKICSQLKSVMFVRSFYARVQPS